MCASLFQFSIFMVAIFIAEAIIGVTGYMLKVNSDDILFDSLNATMYEYHKNSESTSLWDHMQVKVCVVLLSNFHRINYLLVYDLHDRIQPQF